MELIINDRKLDKSNMTLTEILALKVLNDHECLSDVLETLQKASFIDGFSNENITFVTLTNSGKMLLNRILEEGEREHEDDDDKRLEEIAGKLIEMYPKGFKKMIANGQIVDSPYPWRGSVKMIKDRLEKFEENFYDGMKLNLEDVVEATQRYIDKNRKLDEHPFILKWMKTLKYFIYKDGESDLLNYLETEEGEDAYSYDETNGMTLL